MKHQRPERERSLKRHDKSWRSHSDSFAPFDPLSLVWRYSCTGTSGFRLLESKSFPLRTTQRFMQPEECFRPSVYVQQSHDGPSTALQHLSRNHDQRLQKSAELHSKQSFFLDAPLADLFIVSILEYNNHRL